MQPEIEDVVAFTVPYLTPPGVNHYKQPSQYIGRDGYRHLGFRISDAAKAYYDAVAIFAQGRSVAKPKARYAIRVDIFLGRGQRGDDDGFIKCAWDALVKCGMIHTDAAVDGELSRCVVHRDDRTNPRTEYTVIRLEDKA